MNRAEFMEFHGWFTERMRDICQRKSHDYTGCDDPFANFTRVEALGVATTVQGFLTRMTDKLSRLATYANVGKFQVADESVEDTLLDLANYSCLLAGYLRTKRPKTEPQTMDKVWVVKAHGKYIREGYPVGVYPDKTIAELMARNFHAKTWEAPAWTLQIHEEANVDPQHTTVA